MKKLNDLIIPKLKPGLTWDAIEPGLIVKVTAAKNRIFCLQRVYPGGSTNQSIRTLGTFPAMSVEAARAGARRWKAWLAQGIDPVDGEAEEARQRDEARRAKALEQARRTANSFSAVAEEYIADKEGWSKKNRHVADEAREIRRDLVSEWGPMPISSISPADVKALIAKLRRGGSPGGKNGKPRKGSDRIAARAWGCATGIFKFAVFKELIATSPTASLGKKMVLRGADLGARNRVLDDAEIAALWRSTWCLGWPMEIFYKLLVLSALRRSELAEARWSEFHPELRRVLREAAAKREPVDWSRIDDSYKLFTVPAARFKSDAQHLVPLSNDACAILEKIPRFKGCEWLFTENGIKPVNGFSKAKARLDQRMLRALRALARKRGDDPESVALKAWVNHDVRRTVRSKLGDLKLDASGRRVPNHVSELILGHARKGLEGTYDRNSYIDERREALEAWAQYVRKITQPKTPAPTRAGDNIVQLRQAVR